MGLLFKKYKTKFRYALKPVFAFLVAKRKALPEHEWLVLFDKTRKNVTNNPIEYLGEDLPEESLTEVVLEEIFNEFVKEIAFHEGVSQNASEV